MSLTDIQVFAVSTSRHAQHNVDMDQLLEIDDVKAIADFVLTQTGLKK